MRVSTELYNLTDKIGDIWTNGTKVYIVPADSPFLQEVLNEHVYDMKQDTQVTAKSDPVAFVKNLCYKYNGQVYATKPVESK